MSTSGFAAGPPRRERRWRARQSGPTPSNEAPNGLTTVKRRVRQVEDLSHRLLSTAGLRQSEAKISADSQAYWARTGGARWRSDSHWRDGAAFLGNDLWSEIGLSHLSMLERGVRTVGHTGPWGRIVEWGCGATHETMINNYRETITE